MDEWNYKELFLDILSLCLEVKPENTEEFMDYFSQKLTEYQVIIATEE